MYICAQKKHLCTKALPQQLFFSEQVTAPVFLLSICLQTLPYIPNRNNLGGLILLSI